MRVNTWPTLVWVNMNYTRSYLSINIIIQTRSDPHRHEHGEKFPILRLFETSNPFPTLFRSFTLSQVISINNNPAKNL